MIMLAALLAASTPAVAPQPAASAPAPAAPAKKERKICKPDPAFTGSRIEKQLCLTKTEWKRREEAEAAQGASN